MTSYTVLQNIKTVSLGLCPAIQTKIHNR